MEYFWFKALHLIFMVTWFAGLFYMFRLFVYHVEEKQKPDATNMLKKMEYRLYFFITTPGMILTFIFGFFLLGQNPQILSQLWFQIKFTLLILLTIYHLFIGYSLRRFKSDDIFLNSKQCRMINEIPILFLVSIVLLAVFRPL